MSKVEINEFTDGSGESYTEYLYDGLRHRLDGPAIIGGDGWEAWYIFGEFIGNNESVSNWTGANKFLKNRVYIYNNNFIKLLPHGSRYVTRLGIIPLLNRYTKIRIYA